MIISLPDSIPHLFPVIIFFLYSKRGKDCTEGVIRGQELGRITPKNDFFLARRESNLLVYQSQKPTACYNRTVISHLLNFLMYFSFSRHHFSYGYVITLYYLAAFKLRGAVPVDLIHY